MNYIVFDLEFNMFFKFKEGDLANPDLKNEIVQIGAVKLNETLETVSSFNLLIKPLIYKRMNPYVKRKTNIHTSHVARGTRFVEAIKRFDSWIGNDTILCSWGHDDILALRQNCIFFGFDNLSLMNLSFNRFINVQQIYMNLGSLTKQPSLEGAVESLEIEKYCLFHDALSDASYTAEIFSKIYDYSSEAVIDWEKVQIENEIKIEELKTKLDKVDIRCPECNRVIRKDKEVTRSKKYFAFGHCTECNIPIRQVSRITPKNGSFMIVTRNNIYKIEEI